MTRGAAGEGCYGSLEKVGKHHLLLLRGWVGSHCSAGWQWTAVNTAALSGAALGTMPRGDPSRRSCAVRTYAHDVCACVHAREHTHAHAHAYEENITVTTQEKLALFITQVYQAPPVGER